MGVDETRVAGAGRAAWVEGRPLDASREVDLLDPPPEERFDRIAAMAADTCGVEDATDDPRFQANPLVTGDPGIRGYAGHPLHGIDGTRLGTVCIIDRKPACFSESVRAALEDLAAMAEAELRGPAS